MSRQATIRRGKTAPVSRFSQSRQPLSSAHDELYETLDHSINVYRRDQTLADPTKCFQFACLWDDSIGFFTRPEIFSHNGDTLVLGSFSDTIGTTYPIAVTLADFKGHFTTLVPRVDAERLHLAVHPTPPDQVEGPPAIPVVLVGEEDDEEVEDPAEDPNAAPNPVEGTMQRLNFGPTTTNEDRPVIAALPCFLPLAFGYTYPDPLPLMAAESLATTFPVFEIWRRGIQYARNNNSDTSVTKGGPLFYQPSLVLPVNEDPWTNLEIRRRIPQAPVPLPPSHPGFLRIKRNVDELSEATWFDLGSEMIDNIPTLPSTPGGVGLTADAITAIVTPLMAARSNSREKTTSEIEHAVTALDIECYYRLALAGTDASDTLHFPALHPTFRDVLGKTKPLSATQAFQDHLGDQLETCVRSDKALDRDVTFDADACTTMFVNCLRSFHWLTEPIARTTKMGAQSRLSLLHFLTPDRGALLAAKATEECNNPIVLSHISDDKAQLEASKASSLYTGGRLQEWRDVYTVVVNLRMVLLAMMAPTAAVPLLIQKLIAFVDLTNTREGRLFCESYRYHHFVRVHMFQDLQHILSMFLMVARQPSLRKALRDGEAISPRNYYDAARIADQLIDRFRAIITGNSLNEFGFAPRCLDWFPQNPCFPSQGDATPSPKAVLDTPSGRKPSGSPPGHPTGSNPRQTQDPSKKQRTTSPSETDRNKESGMLVFIPPPNGKRQLPSCPVVSKTPGSEILERLCMQFLTRGYYCSRRKCPFPHITTPQRLGESGSKEFISWVKKTPGLDFAPGKAPPGTT